MTIDEAIKWYKDKEAEHRELASMYKEHEEFEMLREDNRQLAEWLMELKDLREEKINLKNDNERLRDCVDSCVHNGELDYAELTEAKRLLKKAVEDLRLVKKCQCCKHQITGYADICYGCHFNTNKYEWRYADEVKKLIGDEPNGVQSI